ncbi:MAG TPA: carboxypeptidase regulatory-like domain-containing protein [Gemmatimonadales bacterium]|nr:carboxypeptidase regulatory-like domain-containing protein [Gemmatimonadales bacterium]
MQLWVRRVVALASFAFAATAVAGRVAAQGVTSASITGTVTQEGGQPLEGATVVVTNTLTGQHFQVTTRAGGRFGLENLPPGGPYTIEARAIGFQPNSHSGVMLSLGQRFAANFAMSQSVVQVQELTVNAAVDPLINKARTGAATTISDSTVSALPTLSRNFTDFVVASPHVVSAPGQGPSIAGSNNRFNNIQIDGAVNNDLFGLGSSGVPGGQNENARPIPLDAVKEFQVLVSPFDVRQGGFTGGLINAVTKSGTNEYHGDVWVQSQNEHFVGNDSANNPLSRFNTTRFGGSLGGPIVRDRAQFFVSADIQHSLSPFSGQLLTGTNATIAQQFTDTLKALYGIDAGTAGTFDANNPATNLFGKVTAQLGNNSTLEVSENYGRTTADHIYANRRTNFDYALTSNMYLIRNTTNSLRAKWTSVLRDRYNNELLVGLQTIRDNRPPNTGYATIVMATGVNGVNLVAGAERFSQANTLDQNIFELTDNVSFDLNAQHRLTVGTHNEFFSFRNVFFPQSIGQWTFASLDSLVAGVPNQYTRALTGAQAGIPGGRTDGPVSDFSVRQYGLYVQDQWSPTPRWTIQAGVRVDDPTFPDKPAFNHQLSDSMGFNTSEFPSGNLLIAPRLGFNYDVQGDGSFILRGGAGVFSGRPPYVWLSNAYGNTGKEQAQLTCTGAGLPAFNNDQTEYTQCVGGGPLNQPKTTINIFDKDFKFQQTARFTLGGDKKLTWGMVGSFDLMYARNYNTLYLNDANLAGVQGHLAGEGNRPVYGDPTLAAPVPIKATGGSNFNQVIVHTNQNKDHAWSASFQVAKNFSDNIEFSVGYTRSRAYDLISQTSSIAASNLGFATLDGTLADRNVRPSAFDRPNKITISGTYHFPNNVSLGLIYIGISGTPYGYTVSGDANFDGIGGSQQNDMFYVPKDSADINLATPSDWSKLNNYIKGESCLNSQRGHVMERTSCRNPWQNFLNGSLTWPLSTHHLEIEADAINLLHLINSDWGIIRTTSGFEGTNIVKKTAYDQANQRNIYSLALPVQNLQSTALSRWRLQVGAKYTF